MGGLAEEERDNEVLIMAFFTNPKGEGHVLMAWLPACPSPQLKNLWFDLRIQLFYTEVSLCGEQTERLSISCHF